MKKKVCSFNGMYGRKTPQSKKIVTIQETYLQPYMREKG